MTVYRHTATGELSQTPLGDPADWAALPATPNGQNDGWRWNNGASAWEAWGPRVWELRQFVLQLLIPWEFLQIRAWQPANPANPSPDDLTFMWARELILTVPRVNLDDPDTAAFLAMCQARSLLTAPRVAAILAGVPFA